MSDKPIIFSAPMVRALIDGRKTQTRRVLRPWLGRQAKWLSMDLLHSVPTCYTCEVNGRYGVQLQHPLAGTTQPYGKVDELSPLTWVRLPYAPGDRLWVKEVWGLGVSDHGDCPRYRATMDYQCGDKIKSEHEGPFKWKSPIHMPRKFSRMTLTVTEVRVQRLQEISAEDCTAEGIPFEADALAPYEWSVSRFADLWNSIHGPDEWDTNPWVCALTFTVHRGNIDSATQTPPHGR